MKKIYRILIIPVIFFSVLTLSCTKTEDNPVIPPTTGSNGTTGTYTSTTNGSLDYDEFSLVVRSGDVPTLTGGGAGTVIFSLNTSSTIESGYPSIPAGYTVIGKYLKAGPESFTFNSPIRIYFPAASQSTPQNLTVFYYSPSLQTWKIIPTSALDTVKKRIGIDVLTLGYFVLTKSSGGDRAIVGPGGCFYDHLEVWTNYYLTVRSIVPQDPAVLSMYADGFVGRTFSGPIFLGCPIGTTKAIVPLGTIEFWLSYSNCQGPNFSVYTYTAPVSVTVTNPLIFNGWSTYDAVVYVPIGIPSGGTWVQGRPTGTGGWAPPTVPYGSGVFQATLTWTNSTSATADMDLHLYGPNNLHIYYGNRSNSDFSLDRDWQSTQGNATENIYSLRNVMPSGDYTVKVKNYAGATMSFNTRVILNGAVSNFSGSLANNVETTVKTFTIP
ncbi:MAG: hypothetical protein JST55_09650 [Bacteroidetes bacterium]|nr:hypothetical protein [Bacteroidota bacterium]